MKKMSSMYLNHTNGWRCWVFKNSDSAWFMKMHAYSGANLVRIAVPEIYICYVICNFNVANINVVALYLSERLNNNLYFTLEKLIFSVPIYIFLSALFCQSEEKFVKSSHEREEAKFSHSQIFHFYKNSKSSHITSVWIFIVIFPSYELYKILWILLTLLSWYSFRFCLVNLSKPCQI